MLSFLIRRVIYGVLTIWAISVVTFMIFFLIPTGDPAVRIAGKSPTPELIAAINVKYHLKGPLPERYFYTMKELLTGQIKSFNIDAKVVPMIFHALPVTLSLVMVAATLWLVIGVAIGVKGARSEGSFLDRWLTIGALIGLSMPNGLARDGIDLHLHGEVSHLPRRRLPDHLPRRIHWLALSPDVACDDIGDRVGSKLCADLAYQPALCDERGVGQDRHCQGYPT